MKIYIDIDGVLLHDSLENNGMLVDGALELLQYVTSKYDCYWLTTHCKGGENHAIEHLGKRIPPEQIKMLEKIKPTDWGLLKTDAIDFTSDFRWLDDDVYSPEMEELVKHNAQDKLIKVNLHENPKQLWEIIESFERKTELIAIKQDITTMEVDAIVNAANRRLLGGGGVDGAIHRAAGQELYDACLKIGGCMEGEAVITPGFKLPAKWIIHTVGPIYGNENGQEAQMLHSCYMNSLYLAMDNNVKTIAFPNISTGVYGYPIDEAAPIAIAAVKEFLAEEKHQIEKVYFVCFSDEDLEVYQKLLN